MNVFLSKPVHVYLLLISLAKIVPIYKSIRTEVSPEFYPFPFVTSNINYRLLRNTRFSNSYVHVFVTSYIAYL